MTHKVKLVYKDETTENVDCRFVEYKPGIILFGMDHRIQRGIPINNLKEYYVTIPQKTCRDCRTFSGVKTNGVVE